MAKFSKLPEKRERYFTIGGSGNPDDHTAIALFETPDGKREAVIGLSLKNGPEVMGFIAFIADMFGLENQFNVAMLELPMIFWKGGTPAQEGLVTTAINEWIEHGQDPCNAFYDCLDDLDFRSFYSDYEDRLRRAKSCKVFRASGKRRSGKGFR
ncbi:MAG: hypothetical protein ACK6BG_03700 [Cyanobacteriota bacterium]